MQYSFSGKVALITGAGSGIGEATAKLLAGNGLSVIVSDFNANSAERVANEITEAGGKAHANTTDVAHKEQIQAAVDFAVAHFGALHYAVNNAGISGHHTALGEQDSADWERVMSINLDGVYHGLRYQIPAILQAGGGAIVNISSVAGLVGMPGIAAYVAAKHGVSGLTKSAALDYAKQGIRINSVHPGAIETPILAPVNDEVRPLLMAAHPMGRFGASDDIAHAVAFLLSDGASYITGTQLAVDGGYTAK